LKNNVLQNKNHEELIDTNSNFSSNKTVNLPLNNLSKTNLPKIDLSKTVIKSNELVKSNEMTKSNDSFLSYRQICNTD
jgi:hypothetical protein